MNSELDKNSLVFDLVWERICKITGWKKYGQLAEYLKITPSSVAGAKQRGFISLEWVYKVAQGYNASTDWLAAGTGSIGRETHLAVAEQHAQYVPEDYVLVPRYEVAASAGGGAVIHSEQIVDYLSFKSDWIRNSLGVSVKDLALISVKGDSMEPTLSNDDLILLDMRAAQVEDHAIYVLQFNGVLLVKRIQRKMDGTVIVKGDNPVYEPDVLQGDAAAQLKVIGRVVWCGRRM